MLTPGSHCRGRNCSRSVHFGSVVTRNKHHRSTHGCVVVPFPHVCTSYTAHNASCRGARACCVPMAPTAHTAHMLHVCAETPRTPRSRRRLHALPTPPLTFPPCPHLAAALDHMVDALPPLLLAHGATTANAACKMYVWLYTMHMHAIVHCRASLLSCPLRPTP